MDNIRQLADRVLMDDARSDNRVPDVELYMKAAPVLARAVEKLLALVKRAATESVVTMSDDPGCFFCDGADGHHYLGCPAAEMLKAEVK